MSLSTAVLVVLWVAAAGRVPTLWRDRRQQMMWATLFTLALVKTFAYAPVAAALDLPMLPHLLGVVAAFFLIRFLALVTGTGGARWQVALAATVLVVLVVLGAASGGIRTRADLLDAHLGGAAVAYWVVLEAYLGAVLGTASVLFATVAREAPGGLPRLGLATMSAGAGLVAVYAAFKTSLIVLHGVGVAVPFTRIEPVAQRFQAAGLLLAVAGALVPATRRARSAAAAYRSLLVLRPLWTAMRDAFPEVILFTPRRAVIELAGVDDVHLRLYRRVIEIRDGMLALRGYLPASEDEATTSDLPASRDKAPKSDLPASGDEACESDLPATRDKATKSDLPASEDEPSESDEGGIGRETSKTTNGNGRTGRSATGYAVSNAPAEARPGTAYGLSSDPAVVEAEGIALALARRAAGEPPSDRPAEWAAVGPQMADEVAWLSRVSIAYRDLPARALTAGARTPRPS